MNEFIRDYEYHLAWAIYLGASVFFCLFWWRLTRAIHHGGWRDLLRGVSLVVMYTPWFVSDARDHLAPAIVVVLMDLLVGSSDNGMAGLIALLVVTAVMLVVLVIRRVLHHRQKAPVTAMLPTDP